MGAFAVALRAAATHFDPTDDDEEEGSGIEIATSDHGGGGHGHGSHSLEETVKAEFTSRPGGGDIKVKAVTGKADARFGHSRKVNEINRRRAHQCSHCGAINKESDGLCWKCGSNPQTVFSEDDLSLVNENLRKAAADTSYVVRKGEEPAPHPIETAATAQDKHEKSSQPGTTEEDVRKRKQVPIWRYWIGSFYAWIDKWKTLTSTHMQSMMVATLVVATVWSIGLLYGSLRLGTSGFIALVGASIIAVMSASLAVLFLLAPGRGKTIGLAYPMGLNVIFLPPLVIAMHEPALSHLWVYSDYVAAWILDTVLSINNFDVYLRENYSMTESLYIAMWFLLSYPLGWTLGGGVYALEQLSSTLSKRNTQNEGVSEDSGSSSSSPSTDKPS